MDPDNNNQNLNTPNQPGDSSTKAWFDNIQSPPPIHQPPAPTTSSPKGIKVVIIILVGLLLLGAAGFAAYKMLASNNQSTETSTASRCLNNNDYLEFVGVKSDEKISAVDNFYAESLRFEPQSTLYAKDSETATLDLLKKIGSFYKKHQDASIKISLSSDYLEGKSAQIPRDRLAKLKEALVVAGVPETAITLDEPLVITVESDSIPEDAPTIISITSDSKCKQ